MRLLIFSVLITLISISISYTQWECPSKLSGFYKPIFNDIPLNWASEISASGGSMDDRMIANVMGFVGLDYNVRNHEFYFEGGFKGWKKYFYDSDINIKNHRLGLREFYYRYNNKDFKLLTGFGSILGKDYMFLNERAFATNFDYNFNKFNITSSVGSVTKDFARNGTFGSKCFIYDFVPNRNIAHISNTFGKTNFSHSTFSYYPNKTIENPELEDEFAEETIEEVQEKIIEFNEIGLVYYDEFGQDIGTNSAFWGLFTELLLFSDVSLRTQVSYQNKLNNDALLYHVSLTKDKLWEKIKQRTSFYGAFYGNTKIDNNASPQFSFSNIQAGEVVRLDGVDMPFSLLSIRHSFMKYRLRFKFQYAYQFKNDEFREFDLIISKKIGEFFDCNLILSNFETNLVNSPNYMAKFVCLFTY